MRNHHHPPPALPSCSTPLSVDSNSQFVLTHAHALSLSLRVRARAMLHSYTCPVVLGCVQTFAAVATAPSVSNRMPSVCPSIDRRHCLCGEMSSRACLLVCSIQRLQRDFSSGICVQLFGTRSDCGDWDRVTQSRSNKSDL